MQIKLIQVGFIVILACVHSSLQQTQPQPKQLQFWRNNDKLIKNWQEYTKEIGLATNSVPLTMPSQQQHVQQQLVRQAQPQQLVQPTQMQFMNSDVNLLGMQSTVPSAVPAMPSQNQIEQPQPQNQAQQQQNLVERKSVESKNYVYANGYPILYNQPAVVVAPPPAPVAAVPVPVGAFPIQQPVISSQGDVIIENTIGGIPFDCRGRPTGHWRDTRFCDIFHACVHGYQRKTYACPIVGIQYDKISFLSRIASIKYMNLFKLII